MLLLFDFGSINAPFLTIWTWWCCCSIKWNSSEVMRTKKRFLDQIFFKIKRCYRTFLLRVWWIDYDIHLLNALSALGFRIDLSRKDDKTFADYVNGTIIQFLEALFRVKLLDKGLKWWEVNWDKAHVSHWKSSNINWNLSSCHCHNMEIIATVVIHLCILYF